MTLSKLSVLSVIQFCFPPSMPKRKKAFLDAIIRGIHKSRSVGYAGYRTRTSLRDDISWRFIVRGIKRYRPPPPASQKRIESVVASMIRRCHRALPIPVPPPLFAFFFPWLGPFDRYDKIMGYVTGFTPHTRTIHIFLSPASFSIKSLRQTIAHEFSHIAFFHRHPLLSPHIPLSRATIRDVLIWEGIAENFTEDLTRTRSPASRVMTRRQADKILSRLKPLLDDKILKKTGAYEALFFGGRRYRKWAGYSLGYHIVRSFRASQPRATWRRIVETDPERVFNTSPLVKKNLGRNESSRHVPFMRARSVA